jgi:hypothetical protein
MSELWKYFITDDKKRFKKCLSCHSENILNTVLDKTFFCKDCDHVMHNIEIDMFVNGEGIYMDHLKCFKCDGYYIHSDVMMCIKCYHEVNSSLPQEEFMKQLRYTKIRNYKKCRKKDE